MLGTDEDELDTNKRAIIVINPDVPGIKHNWLSIYIASRIKASMNSSSLPHTYCSTLVPPTQTKLARLRALLDSPGATGPSSEPCASRELAAGNGPRADQHSIGFGIFNFAGG